MDAFAQRPRPCGAPPPTAGEAPPNAEAMGGRVTTLSNGKRIIDCGAHAARRLDAKARPLRRDLPWRHGDVAARPIVLDRPVLPVGHESPQTATRSLPGRAVRRLRGSTTSGNSDGPQRPGARLITPGPLRRPDWRRAARAAVPLCLETREEARRRRSPMS